MENKRMENELIEIVTDLLINVGISDLSINPNKIRFERIRAVEKILTIFEEENKLLRKSIYRLKSELLTWMK